MSNVMASMSGLMKSLGNVCMKEGLILKTEISFVIIFCCKNQSFIDPAKEPEKGVLILSTWSSSNVPIITNLTGVEITNFDFAYDDETVVLFSCSIVWQNENYVFGGYNKERQIAKIDGCRLRRIGELAFNHEYGGCANVNNEQILLCFHNHVSDFSGMDKCRNSTSPTGVFEEIPRSNFKHQYTKIAASDSKLF